MRYFEWQVLDSHGQMSETGSYEDAVKKSKEWDELYPQNAPHTPAKIRVISFGTKTVTAPSGYKYFIHGRQIYACVDTEIPCVLFSSVNHVPPIDHEFVVDLYNKEVINA